MTDPSPPDWPPDWNAFDESPKCLPTWLTWLNAELDRYYFDELERANDDFAENEKWFDRWVTLTRSEKDALLAGLNWQKQAGKTRFRWALLADILRSGKPSPALLDIIASMIVGGGFHPRAKLPKKQSDEEALILQKYGDLARGHDDLLRRYGDVKALLRRAFPDKNSQPNAIAQRAKILTPHLLEDDDAKIKQLQCLLQDITP